MTKTQPNPRTCSYCGNPVERGHNCLKEKNIVSSMHKPEEYIVLLKDVKLQSSNRIATTTAEFDEVAYSFPIGTKFKNYGRGRQVEGEDEDCVESGGLHGWCYSLPDQHRMWQYCNFHAYILDYWPQYPTLFKKEEA